MKVTFEIPAALPPLHSPFFSDLISCGVMSPCAGHEDNELNLHEHVVKNRPSTFFVRASGHSMKDAGICDGAILVVDRSLTATEGSIVIALVDGEFTVKMLQLHPELMLMPCNPAFSPIRVDPEELEIWGVVTFAVNQY
ncbi:translesion error-prone DNA polymerase V autoproteolytic subunit [Escherichia coli]